MPDFEQLRDGLQKAIPFNKHLALKILEISEGKAVVLLPDHKRLHNHVGSQHAGGLFAAGEAASGGAFLGTFSEHMEGITALAKSAGIEYVKLAKGEITATGTLEHDAADIIDGIDGEEGKAEFPVGVEMKDEGGQVVATMTVRWHVRRTES